MYSYEINENYPPQPVMTTQAMPSYTHHAPIKAHDDRARSPTVLTSAPQGHDSEMSPLPTSHSSDSCPSSSDYQYHHPHQYQVQVTAAPSVPSSYMSNHEISQGSHPTAQGWGAPPSSAPVQGSVPHVVSAHEVSAAHFPTTSYQPQPKTQPPSPVGKQKTVVTAKKRYTKGGGRTSNGDKPRGDTVNVRRQKRLERNRESARLSRRRRKHYLEVLEDRVTHLSVEVDQGRREHASKAIETILDKRGEILESNPTEDNLAMLDRNLNRTSQELLVVSTFQTQQLKSFSLAPHVKFVLWLTLQGDTYFRGGRAASERLSAARIGERMLQSGNDRVSPVHSMWPLYCNEVGLSYDQEERVRNYQRTLLQTPSTWLDRHTARASGLAMDSLHDCFNSVAVRIRQRERGILSDLTPAQKLKFHMWAHKNGDRLRDHMNKKKQANAKPKQPEKYELSHDHHVAANLYILNNRLQQILLSLPKQVSLVSAADLKKLSRRPSFESLGQQNRDEAEGLTREASFASSGSLKRSASALSMDDSDKPPPQQVSPEDGQEAAIDTVEQALGFIKEIIPAPRPLALPQPVAAAPAQMPIPTPAPSAPVYHHYAPVPPAPQTVSYQPVHPSPDYPPPVTHAAPHPGAPTGAYHHQPHPTHQVVSHAHHVQHVTYTAPPPQHQEYYQESYQPQQQHQESYQPQQQHQQQQAPPPPPQLEQPPVQHQQMVQPQAPAPAPQSGQQPPTHTRQSSFLPPHLNVVPEEMFPNQEGAEDFFMSLMDGEDDWAIGEGVDMDTAV